MLPPEIVTTDAALFADRVVDWTGRVRGEASAIVRPRGRDEVRRVIEEARRHRVGIHVQGGNTSLAGGAVPHGDEVILDTVALDQLTIHEEALIATVGAGVPLGRLQRELAQAGLAFGVDLGARDQATLGGMAATNAGGVHVVRFGAMRANVLAIGGVLGSGRALPPARPLVKDAAGPPLGLLLIGSEGAFGVITELVVRLLPKPRHRALAVIAVPDIGRAVALSAWCRQRIEEIVAVEYLGADAVRLATAVLGRSTPWGAAGALFVEAHLSLERLMERLSGASEGWIGAEEGPRFGALWAWRDELPLTISRVGVPRKLDLSVPIWRLTELEQLVRDCAGRAGVTTACFGHVGDGNLHVNLLGEEAGLARASSDIHRAVIALGGSITAEHGVGSERRAELAWMRTPTELALLGELCQVFDPDAILNEGVLIERRRRDGGS